MVNDIKVKIKEVLKNSVDWYNERNSVQFVTRCPFCGDTQNSLTRGHFDIKINVSNNFPIVYNCYRCPVSGIFNSDTLEQFGIHDINIKNALNEFNKNSEKFDKFLIYNNYDSPEYSYVVPDIKISDKTKYINDRLGLNLSASELKPLRIITSLKDFLLVNNLRYITCKKFIAKKIESDYVGFLSTKGMYILFRNIKSDKDFRWIKYRVPEQEVIGVNIFYSIENTANYLSTDNININICEGPLDILSIYYNLGFNGDNNINIAIAGKNHISMIKYIIHLGFVGNNITLNIFSDKDNTYDTSLKYYKDKLSLIKNLFGSTYVYYNIIGKDYGVKRESIILEKFKI